LYLRTAQEQQWREICLDNKLIVIEHRREAIVTLRQTGELLLIDRIRALKKC
jgi:hypothetical protein